MTRTRLEVSAASHVSQPAAAEKNQFYGGTCPWVGLKQQPSYIPHLQAFDSRLFLAYTVPSFLRPLWRNVTSFRIPRAVSRWLIAVYEINACQPGVAASQLSAHDGHKRDHSATVLWALASGEWW